ncbi:MAG: hypothetical protein DWQ07_16555 [Chloroflexi bacterium]|nr:MAG: hypothetical protein DWQ07_16555 [Chloroflexota bacterium]MBL1195365.1 hypothetical protein [Chloroflexota bacterium]NOH12649.1 hypothetical protein [Chloroflexota bacterium]
MSELSRPLHRRLPFLAPSTLDEAVGYGLSSRFYAVHWQPGGEELYITDGLRGYTTPGWGFLVFTHNHQVIPFLSSYDFGSADSLPKHMLVVDTLSRETFAMPLVEARAFLQKQHAPLNARTLALRRRELHDAIDANFEVADLDKDEVLDALEQAEVSYPDLEAELDAGLRLTYSLS